MRRVIVIGGGGHAKVLMNALQCLVGVKIVGYSDEDPKRVNVKVLGVPMIGTDRDVGERSPEDVTLVNGIGSVGVSPIRKNVFSAFRDKGFGFETVVHHSVVKSYDVLMGEGVQIMAGAVIQPGCTIGDNTLINTGASIDHDCVIGDHVHIAPGAVICGGVTVCHGCHVGTGAMIIQGVTIEPDTLVKAGTINTRSRQAL